MNAVERTINFFVFQGAIGGAEGHGDRQALFAFGEAFAFVDVEDADAFTIKTLGGFLGEFSDVFFDISGVDGLIDDECEVLT